MACLLGSFAVALRDFAVTYLQAMSVYPGCTWPMPGMHSEDVMRFPFFDEMQAQRGLMTRLASAVGCGGSGRLQRLLSSSVSTALLFDLCGSRVPLDAVETDIQHADEVHCLCR